MSLNIGIHVKKQHEGYMSYGNNPKGTVTEIEANFDVFLRGKFPDAAFNPSVSLVGGQQYEFDVRMNYDWNDYDTTPMYLAIFEFILTHFSVDYGIEMHVYHSP